MLYPTSYEYEVGRDILIVSNEQDIANKDLP